MKRILTIFLILLLFNVLNTVKCYSQRTAIAMDVSESDDIDGLDILEDLNIYGNATINLHNFETNDDVKVPPGSNGKLKIKPGGTVIIGDGIGLYSDGKTSKIEDGVIWGQVFVGDENNSHTLEITGGEFHSKFWTYKESLIEITGHDFNYDFGNIRYEEFDVESGVTTEYNRTGIITGTLENGQEINCEFRMMGNSNIELIED